MFKSGVTLEDETIQEATKNQHTSLVVFRHDLKARQRRHRAASRGPHPRIIRVITVDSTL